MSRSDWLVLALVWALIVFWIALADAIALGAKP